jgi:hypothetical protein
MPTFSLAYTSVRPECLKQVINIWNNRSKLHDHEWIIAYDKGNTEMLNAAKALQNASTKIVENSISPDCNSGWNVAAEHSTGKVIICVADDFNPPRDWDSKLLGLKPLGWENEEHVVKVDDGYVHNVFVLSILTRKRYDRFGYVFYPKYRCLPESTPILYADFSTKLMKDLSVGDCIYGIVLKNNSYESQVARVIAIDKWKANLKNYVLKSGRTITCTDSHRWACSLFNVDLSSIKRINGISYANAAIGTKLLYLLNYDTANIAEDEIVNVEDSVLADVYSIETSTGNFIANGYLSSNSMFNDTEFGEVAVRDGVVINANHLLFEHMHPDCGKRARDKHDILHASQQRWKASEMLYKFRRAHNFPLDAGPKAIDCSNLYENKNYVAYMQITKDDFCLNNVCDRLIDEGVKDFAICQPSCYWSGESIAPEDSQQVEDLVAKLKAKGMTVHHQLFHVEPELKKAVSRIDAETAIRNQSLSWIRSLGYSNILIVDGDELWMPGTLKVIDSYVHDGHKVISCGLTPVIGFPGYPVEGALDSATVYVGNGIVFRFCRSTYAEPACIPTKLIYHFTGTRKTLEETINKHKRSGHYSDPNYDFEGWLKNVLPNIRPGLKNVHMYKPVQIWPSIRKWTTDELQQMPKDILKYLGSTSI